MSHTRTLTPLTIQPPLAPMEATSVESPPEGREWQYEPKWDGFRCLAFRNGAEIYLQSKSGQPLARYFPDLVETLSQLGAQKFVLDGEIVIPIDGRFSFDALLQRIHPAASRIQRLATETPARYIAFDLLLDLRGNSLLEQPLAERRTRLERFAERYFPDGEQLVLSPTTQRLATARTWLSQAGGDRDGIVAKRRDLPYHSGERDAMQKIKPRRTADCVVGGFRYAKGKRVLGSLLLGLFDDQGLLHHVGFTSSFKAAERQRLTDTILPYQSKSSFTGQTPGGPSRWNNGAETEWIPLRPELVIEVEYDHFTGGRFRHGTRLLRWRPDKAPSQCTFHQLGQRR